jgi:hypothetical protein
MLRSAIAFSFLSLMAAATAAEEILLPILTPETPGAHGSIWASEVWIYNASDHPISVGGLFPPGASQIPAKTTYGATGSNRNVPGGFISVAEGEGQHLRFNLRVRDVSRQALTWGTQISVVESPSSSPGPYPLSISLSMSASGKPFVSISSLSPGGR